VTLNQALALIRERKGRGQKRVQFLVCGFQPLHLGTFLNAHVAERFPEDHVEVLTGLYGDFAGNLAKAADSPATGAAVAMEWADIDPRLGLRSSGGWSGQATHDIAAGARERCAQFAAAVERVAARMPVALAPPSLPLPPIGNTVRAQSSVLELELAVALDSFLLQLARLPGVRIADRWRLEQLSPGPARLDARMELMAGFPYSISHAAALGWSLAEVLYPRAPKKGLITDLDDTLWAGIVGEVGPDAVTWHQDSHTQLHGLYQQMLGHLADCGVLLGVSSKNEIAVARAALARKDLLLDAGVLFPVVANWGPKSIAVGEILKAWNIGADSVVFVDDNPMELSEVRQALPAITCLEFPKNDAAKLWAMLGELRDLFGKPVLLEEDRLRRSSIRATVELREAGADTSSPAFLRGLEGTVTLDYRKNPTDKRPLELINKTNQFNLNGRRISEGEWRRWLEADDVVTVVVSYQDKFGPLGKIAVFVGQRQGHCLGVLHWVMSCRAFSRRIEHHTLDGLFGSLPVEAMEFAFEPTPRNQPLQEFFQSLRIEKDAGGVYRLSHSQWLDRRGSLPHQISES
jgi:FkbH-like protein